VSDAVFWHDLECGSYRADLPLWRELAAGRVGPVLDVGAGTGRVALELARAGHEVTALDRDGELLAALGERAAAAGVAVRTVLADARRFSLGDRFACVLVPMQTIQLLGGACGRELFLRRARAQLHPGGTLAIALASRLEPFELGDGDAGPLPEIAECDGRVYCSRPTAVRAHAGSFELERRRELIAADGTRTIEHDLVRLDRLSARALEREGERCGLRVDARRTIPATRDHVGSEVVVFGG
jgi:SAM-dependent methyltransferase